MSNDIYIIANDFFTVRVSLSKRDHCTPIAFFVVRARCSSDQLPADLPNNGKSQFLLGIPRSRKNCVSQKNHLNWVLKVVKKSKNNCL